MNERYWIEQVAKKDAEIKELNDKLREALKSGEFYHGRYIGNWEKAEGRVVIDETFKDMLTEEELEKISKADKPKKKK